MDNHHSSSFAAVMAAIVPSDDNDLLALIVFRCQSIARRALGRIEINNRFFCFANLFFCIYRR